MYGYHCEHCDGTVRPKKVQREAFKHKKGFIILEDVVIGACDACGARYYSADILHAVNDIANGTNPSSESTRFRSRTSQHESFARLLFAPLGHERPPNPNFAPKKPIIFLTTHPRPVKLEEWSRIHALSNPRTAGVLTGRLNPAPLSQGN